MSRASDLETLLTPVIAAQGCELWHLEFSVQGRRSLLRIYIDSPAGISLDDCERVSRQVSAVLDVEDPIVSAYTLEVSSPGLDRQLHKPEQFARYIGAIVAVKLRMPYEGRRRFQGRLNGLEDGDLVLQVEDTEFLLPLDTIEKAQVVPVFGAAEEQAGDTAVTGAVREGDVMGDEPSHGADTQA